MGRASVKTGGAAHRVLRSPSAEPSAVEALGVGSGASAAPGAASEPPQAAVDATITMPAALAVRAVSIPSLQAGVRRRANRFPPMTSGCAP